MLTLQIQLLDGTPILASTPAEFALLSLTTLGSCILTQIPSP